jgi:hypothetical protein
MAEITEKAKDAAGKVAKLAQDGISQAKDKSHKLTLKRKMNGFASELGNVVYRQKQGEVGLDAEVERLVGEMRAAEAELKAAEAG